MTCTIQNIEDLIIKREWRLLRNLIQELDPLQIADIIEELNEEDEIVLFRLLLHSTAKETFQHLSHRKQEEIITGLAQNLEKLASLLNDLEPDDRTAFLEELPGQISQKLIQLLSPGERAIATKLLGYPEDSIGRLMTPEYVAVKPDYTVEETMNHIRKYGRDSETLNVIYIVTNEWKLIDDIKIREILLAKPNQTIGELMDNRFVALSAYDDQEVAIREMQDHDRVALPVVDSEGVLLGIVTFDDVMDIAEEESTEDFHKFGAFQDAIVNPLKAKVSFLFKKRVVWLFALVFMNVFSGSAIAVYEDTIASLVSLVFFLPLLIDSGGNAGAQSATLIIRSLATGDVVTSDWIKLVGREFVISLMLGLTMALGVSLVASFRAPEIIGVVAITMTLVVIAGSMIGLLLPFLFTKLNLDPATASAPLITSIADITGVVIYFSIASWYFGL